LRLIKVVVLQEAHRELFLGPPLLPAAIMLIISILFGMPYALKKR